MNTLTTSIQIKDLMTRDVVTARPNTSIAEVARLLIAHRIGCVPVIDKTGHIMGIISTSDLFVKQTPLPNTHHVFMTLFKAPVMPQLLKEAYAIRESKCTAADIMTQDVVHITESESVCKAVQLMTQYTIKRLPVLDEAPEAGGRLVGILTRSDIIKYLSGHSEPIAVCAPV